MDQLNQQEQKFSSRKGLIKIRKAAPVLVIVFAAFVLMLPLFLGQARNGYDTLFHIANIDHLHEQMKINFLFPSKIMDGIGFGLGYGTYLFYPPLSHFVAAYLNFMTHDTIVSIQIAHFLFLALSGLTMYFTSLRIAGSRRVGLISGLIYLLFPYHLTDIYVRDAFSECALFAFLPLIIWGLYELFANEPAIEDKQKTRKRQTRFYVLFVVGYSGGMLSHLTLMIPFTVLVLLFLLIRIKDTIRKERFLPLIIAGVFILLITSPFWISVLLYKLHGGYTVFSGNTMYEGIEWYGLSLSKYDLLWNRGQIEMRYFIPIPVIILLIVTLCRMRRYRKPYSLLLFFTGLTFCLTTVYWPWKWMPSFLKMVQFPSRFQVFFFLALALLAPVCLNGLKERTARILVPAIALFLILSGFQHVGMSSELVDRDHFDDNNGMGWQKEYLPVAANEQLDVLKNRGAQAIVREGYAEITQSENQVPSYSFTLQKAENPVVELPRIYYLGYRLQGPDGQQIHLYQNERGLLQADLYTDGTYSLTYTGTAAERTAPICAGLAILAFTIFLFLRTRPKRAAQNMPGF